MFGVVIENLSYLSCHHSSITMVNENHGNIVVVTGGNGFLGQHIVKLLHQQKYVQEIRVFDIQTFEKKLGEYCI